MANKANHLGEFEYLVLLNIVSLKDNAYGVTIRQQFKQVIGREVSIGAIYATTERLEKKGLLSSYKNGATAERGGKAKRFYQITAAGQQAVAQTKSQMDSMWNIASINFFKPVSAARL